MIGVVIADKSMPVEWSGILAKNRAALIEFIANQVSVAPGPGVILVLVTCPHGSTTGYRTWSDLPFTDDPSLCGNPHCYAIRYSESLTFVDDA